MAKCFYCDKEIVRGGKTSPRGYKFHKACYQKYFNSNPKGKRREW